MPHKPSQGETEPEMMRKKLRIEFVEPGFFLSEAPQGKVGGSGFHAGYEFQRELQKIFEKGFWKANVGGNFFRPSSLRGVQKCWECDTCAEVWLTAWQVIHRLKGRIYIGFVAEF